MEIRERTDGESVVVVELSGRLDAGSAQEAERRLTEAAGSARNVIVNLGGVEYISSAGLRSLLVVAKKVRQLNGVLGLCLLSKGVREVFDISGFSSIFTLYDSEEAAKENMK
jgi:anti-sigma B factor antagonist